MTRYADLPKSQSSRLFDSRRSIRYLPASKLVRGISIVTRMGIVVYPPSMYLSSVYRYTPMIAKSIAYGLASLVKRELVYIRQERHYGLIHSSWTLGYYHWVTEALPRAYVLHKAYPSAIPLIPAQYKKYEDSLLALGFKEVCYYPIEANVVVDNLVHTSCPPIHAYVCQDLLIDVSETVRSYYHISFPKKACRLVYISRQRSRGRKVINELEVVSLVLSLGGEVLHAEEMSFVEQVTLMSETAVLVSIHGAGLANSMFMPTGSSIIEMLPYKNGIVDFNWNRFSFRHEICYQLLACTFGLNYEFLECMHNAGAWTSTHMADIYVDVNALRRLILLHLS